MEWLLIASYIKTVSLQPNEAGSSLPILFQKSALFFFGMRNTKLGGTR